MIFSMNAAQSAAASGRWMLLAIGLGVLAAFGYAIWFEYRQNLGQAELAEWDAEDTNNVIPLTRPYDHAEQGDFDAAS